MLIKIRGMVPHGIRFHFQMFFSFFSLLKLRDLTHVAECEGGLVWSIVDRLGKKINKAKRHRRLRSAKLFPSRVFFFRLYLFIDINQNLRFIYQ